MADINDTRHHVVALRDAEVTRLFDGCAESLTSTAFLRRYGDQVKRIQGEFTSYVEALMAPSAAGDGKSKSLTLLSRIEIQMDPARPGVVEAFTKTPNFIALSNRLFARLAA